MAKYKIIPSSRTIVQSPISIGHKAEKGVEAIEFDLAAWVETYGSGTATIIMRRWGDAIPYPVALELDENNKATWTLSDTDTAKAGMAYAQLSYIVGETVVKKSDIYTFRVMDSLTGEGEPPEAYESWLEHLTHLAAEAMAEVLDIEGIVTDKTLTIDGGIADAKATGDALGALEDQFTEETDKLKADLNKASHVNQASLLEQGTFGTSSGNPSPNTQYIRTKEYLDLSLLTITKPAGVGMTVYYYANPTRDANGYLGHGTWSRNAARSGSFMYVLDVYPTATHVKIRFDITDVNPITVNDILSAGVVIGYLITAQGLKDAIDVSKSVLYGKKWVACGDSFTHGDFSGIDDDPTKYTFQNGLYQGQKMVYPYFIGNRTGCIVINEAINGSHMGYKAGRGNKNFSAENGRYTQIPRDADYITLYFGINDGPNHQNIPLGAINDNTNETFYGAWNVVMSYLITNHPNAKIGIIISNACDTIDYPNAEIAIAKKFGVAYLDMNGDPKIPFVFRTNGKTDLDPSILAQRNNQYYVGNGNGHPNPACHEDESTFIQAWLESI